MAVVIAGHPGLGNALHRPVPSWVSCSELPVMKSLEEPFGKAAWGGTEASQPTASTKFPGTKRGGGEEKPEGRALSAAHFLRTSGTSRVTRGGPGQQARSPVAATLCGEERGGTGGSRPTALPVVLGFPAAAVALGLCLCSRAFSCGLRPAWKIT